MATSTLLSPLPPLEQFALSDVGKNIKKEVEEARDKMCEMIEKEREFYNTTRDRHMKHLGAFFATTIIVMVAGTLTMNGWLSFTAILLFLIIQTLFFLVVHRSDREHEERTQAIREQFAEHFRSIVGKHPSLISDLLAVSDPNCDGLAKFLVYMQK